MMRLLVGNDVVQGLGRRAVDWGEEGDLFVHGRNTTFSMATVVAAIGPRPNRPVTVPRTKPPSPQSR